MNSSNGTSIQRIAKSERPDLSSMSAEELKAGLVRCLCNIAQNLREASWYVRELDKQKADLTALKIGAIKYLRLIAYGQVCPELVSHFWGWAQLLNVITSLPMPDQERLAEGGQVRLLTYAPDGSLTHRMVDPRELAQSQVRQVFDRGAIRSDAEQRSYLEEARQKKKQTKPPVVGPLKIDPEREGAVCGRTFISLADLKAAVRALKRG